MRKTWLAGLAVALISMLATFATVAPASAWTCRASSSTGSWGVGWHNHSRNYARQRALLECAARTPRNRVCYIRWCRK